MTACASKFSALLLALLPAAATVAQDAVPPVREAAATIVVYNARDPESRALAGYYAERRGIPDAQVIGLECPATEEITREEYRTTIEEPLRARFEREGWWKVTAGPGGSRVVTDQGIRFVALIRGVPLKIRTTIPPPEPGASPPPRPNGGDPITGHDEAAVDSELAALGAFENEHFGIMYNPFFRRFAPVVGSEVTGGMLLVGRLDAPTAGEVRRMIDESLLAERTGLYGWAYIDRRSIPESGYREGDDWLQRAAAECWNHGIPVILDNNPTIFPDGFAVTDAALYYGWYTATAGGAMAAPRFTPGAVAVHIHSFSAASLRNPAAHWAAPLLVRGAAATMGNVYEPYLDLTPHLDIFNDRLLGGFTFAESAYMSLKVLSWMSTIVGDPLYRPFGSAAGGDWRSEPDAAAAPWLALQKQLRQGARTGPTQILYLSRWTRENPTGLNYEALGMLQSFHGEPREALQSFESAGPLHPRPAEAFRTVIERVRVLQSIGDKAGALKLVDRTLQRTQPPDRAKLLQDLRNEISPPPPPPSPGPSPKKP
jgi:uncharacterized protein (TIGR03790 family)